MTKLYVVSKSDLKKLAGGRSSSNRSFAVLNGEELDLDERAIGPSSSNRSFAALDGEELYLDERASAPSSSNRSFVVLDGEELDVDEHASEHSVVHLSFAMLYLGLFIGFLITTIAVSMPNNKHTVFVIGTIVFAAVSLWLWIWWLFTTKRNIPPKKIQKLPTYEDTVQID